jgi:hypothetical protein
MSARWSGLFKPELSEIYTFLVSADNGIRIHIDGLLSVDQWEVQAGGEPHFYAVLVSSLFIVHMLNHSSLLQLT